MKRNTSITLHVVLLLAATLTTVAQSGRTPGNKPEQRPVNAPGLAGIDLTNEQKASLKTIHNNTEQQIQSIRNNQTLSEAEKHAQIESVQQNARQQSQGVLTPEQQQALGNRRGNQGDLGKVPNLTDEQKGQLQTIRQQEREQIQTVKNDSTLSDADKRSRIDTIRQNSREQAQGILTPEQREAVANRQANGGGRPGGGQGQPGGRPNDAGGRMSGQGNPNGGGFGGGQRPGGFGGGMGGGPRGGRP